MALMKFREANQVLWRGVRPGHNGTQVSADKDVTNAIAIIHTVTAGTTFHLCTLCFSRDSNIAGVGYLFYRDAADLNPVYFFAQVGIINVPTAVAPLYFWPPLELPAGYDVCVRAVGAGLIVRGYVFGWEE